MATYAPVREDGKYAYVIVRKSMWSEIPTEYIEWSTSLKEARAQFTWTREPHVSLSTRRATPEDVERLTRP